MKASLTRRYHFAASHRLHTPVFSKEENARIFGKCNNPYGHGHNYVLSVTVHGHVDPHTGQVSVLETLDAYVNSRVLQHFASRNINLDVPAFQNLVPTTENLVLVIARMLDENWTDVFGTSGPRLSRVHVQETGRNSFELLLPETRLGKEEALLQDAVPVSR
jgi:6-pyruvoyltetrahydropterin/6-carboxytetrahydropterin synthase